MDRQFSFAHTVKAVKMAVVREAFSSDRLCNDFDQVQMKILKGTDMIPLEVICPSSLNLQSRLVLSSLTVKIMKLATGLKDAPEQ